ncbi:MAG: ABC transporter permease [Defluviitaleaceae bacterium]|nr:ABC transporter permease [Defluviitaleaceae bacterium]
MKNSILLAKANLQKSKGNAIGLVVVMLFVAMFINIGFVMLFGIGTFFERRAEELNSGHIITHLSEDETFAAAQMQFLTDDDRVKVIEVQSFVAGDGEVMLNNLPNLGYLMFSRVYENQVLNPLTMVGDYLPLTGNAVYVPHYMVLLDNLTLGDTIVLSFMDTELEFTFAGSIDEIMFGSINAFRRRLYVSDAMFAELQQQFPDEMTEVAVVQLHDVADAGVFNGDFIRYMTTLTPSSDAHWIISFTQDFLVARASHTLMPTLLGSILAVFAIVFLVVSLIVIRFRINNSIDEGMINIGTLKALGYRNRQIVASILMQFGFIAAVGGAIGLALGHLAIPAVVSIMGPMFSLQWQPEINLPAMLIMLALILLSVILFSLLSTKRIYKLYPLVALRGGFATHNFKNNALQLDKMGGPLPLLLAIKDILHNKRQAIAVGIIVLAVAFTATIGLGTNYMINVNSDEFLNTMVGEPFDLAPILRSADSSESLAQRLYDSPQVDRFTGYMNNFLLSIEGLIISADVVEDHGVLHGQTLVNGRFPIHANEIALGRVVLRELDKNIGDTVYIHSGGAYFPFIITGQTQSTDSGGLVASIPFAGVHRMHKMDIQAFLVFLHEGACGIEFAETLRESEGDVFMNILVFDELAESFIDSMGGIFAGVAVAILIVVAVIVMATMYLVIKTAILRKRKELGIQKALGFTTWQLMNQIALNLAPAIILGAAAGALVAYHIFDFFFTLIMGMSGDISVSLPMSIGMTAAAAVGIVILAYVVSMLVAWRIRKISAYALVSE